MGRKNKTRWFKSEEKDLVWELDGKSAKEKADDCEYHRNRIGAQVVVSPKAMMKVMTLVLKYDDSEFLCYLLGDKKTNHVEDIYVPKQRASWASVDMDEDLEIPPNVIGALHKHPGNSKPSFSHTDCEKLNVNHDISIVIPENGSLENWFCTIRSDPPCGCEAREEADVLFEMDPETLAQAEKNVNQSKSSGGYGGYSSGHDDYWNGVANCNHCDHSEYSHGKKGCNASECKCLKSDDEVVREGKQKERKETSWLAGGIH